MRHQHNQNGALERLSTSNLALATPRLDIRGRTVIDRHGNRVGYVSKLFINASDREVRLLEVCDGGFLGLGTHRFLLPVEAITDISNNEVRVNQRRDRVVESPIYDPVLVNVPYWEHAYGSYSWALDWIASSPYPGLFILPDDAERDEDFDE